MKSRTLTEMSYRDLLLESDLQRMDREDACLSRVLAAKRGIRTLRGKENLDPGSRARLAYYEAKLKDIPDGFMCECCGRKDLVRVCRIGVHIVGRECRKHEFGRCRQR